MTFIQQLNATKNFNLFIKMQKIFYKFQRNSLDDNFIEIPSKNLFFSLMNFSSKNFFWIFFLFSGDKNLQSKLPHNIHICCSFFLCMHSQDDIVVLWLLPYCLVSFSLHMNRSLAKINFSSGEVTFSCIQNVRRRYTHEVN